MTEDFNKIDPKNDTIAVQRAKKEAQKKEELCIITEQGMFGDLGMEDPNIINVDDKKR